MTSTKTPATVALGVAADAAYRAYCDARAQFTRDELGEEVLEGADGTPSKHIDVYVEDAIIEAVADLGVNILSEERGWIDQGSAFTMVVDPVDGTSNAAA